MRPVFRDGTLFCYLASVAHWHDVGGNVPGNYNPAATESFQEGMLIPPIKLFDRGTYRADIVEILKANSRLPESLWGDLNGQINALDLGLGRLNEMLDHYGDDTVRRAFVALRQRAAARMREHIAALPDGTYVCADQLDNDGIVDQPLAIALTMRVAGDRLTLDFSGSAAACAGPVNISRSTAIAACYVALKHIFRDVAANAGVLEPIDVVIPDDSLLSARAPRPVGGYTETILRVIDVIFGAMARCDPARSNGCAYGTINALSLSGHRDDGRRWVMFSFFGGGHGGHPQGDGLNHGNAPISTATIPPVEILEAAYPVRFTQWALRPDSAGAGAHRGGLGGLYEFELMADRAELFLFGERGRSGPPGVAGGCAAAPNRFAYQTATGWESPSFASKLVGATLEKGQRVRLETPGGGGYGDPAARAPEAIARDVALGYLTSEERAGSDGSE